MCVWLSTHAQTGGMGIDKREVRFKRVTKVNPNKAEEKLRLKRWVLARCKEACGCASLATSLAANCSEPHEKHE